jgi:hypothetical protein
MTTTTETASTDLFRAFNRPDFFFDRLIDFPALAINYSINRLIAVSYN